ncbi:hypothetical protein H106_07270, partial [Trichophyton rubrum CBS 735.88]
LDFFVPQTAKPVAGPDKLPFRLSLGAASGAGSGSSRCLCLRSAVDSSLLFPAREKRPNRRVESANLDRKQSKPPRHRQHRQHRQHRATPPVETHKEAQDI